MKRKLNVISESWWVLCNQDWRVGETGGRRRRRNRRGVQECTDISNTWSQQCAAAAASRQPGIFIKTTFGDKN